MTDRESCIYLNLIPGVGAVRYRKLVEAFGTAGAIPGQSAEALGRVKGIGEALAARIADPASMEKFRDEMVLAARGRVRIVTPADEDYPSKLREIADPPLALYIRGELPAPGTPSVAIVGSRRMSAYGERMARNFAAEAASCGWTVISGLAYGVDFAAHDAAVKAGGRTLAVLPGGLGRIHPQEHIPLARSIVVGGGAVISECPLTFPVNRQSFPRRNRIVSGLSDAVLVIEAGVDSGAMITANLALEHNRTLFAVPGQADNLQARGCHQLIKNGSARLAESFADVLAEFEYLPGMAGTASAMPSGGDVPEPSPHAENPLVALVAAREQSLEDLAAATGEDSGNLLAELMKLELSGILARAADGKYHIAT